MRSPICMVHNLFQIEHAFTLTVRWPVRWRRGPSRWPSGRHPPAQDPPRVGVDDEGDIGEARPRGYIGEVATHSRLVLAGEPPLHKIGRPRAVGRRSWCAWSAPNRAGQFEFGHQPLDGAAATAMPSRFRRATPCGTVDAVVGGVHPGDLALRSSRTWRGWLPVDVVVTGRWRSHTQLVSCVPIDSTPRRPSDRRGGPDDRR